jgi:signal transduction histidine kinase
VTFLLYFVSFLSYHIGMTPNQPEPWLTIRAFEQWPAAQSSDLLLPVVIAAAAGFVFGAIVALFIYQKISEKKLNLKIEQNARQEAERARQAERKRMHGIYNLISVLSSSLNYQRILDSLLDLSATILGSLKAPSDRLVSAVLLFTDKQNKPGQLSVGSSRRFTSADNRLLFPAADGLLRKVVETGEPALINNIYDDPELSRIVALRGCQVVAAYPLRAGLDTYGVLLFAHKDIDFFSADRTEILEIVSKQAVNAIQNARLYLELEQEKERMLDIQEEARKKLARDLHDGPTQSVAAISMRVNFARRLMDRDLRAAEEELYKIEDLARQTTKEIRHMLFTLRPLVLESQGLVQALEAMAQKMKETYNQMVVVSAKEDAVSALEVSKQAVVFYIVEEAVSNARKHAQAAQVLICIKLVDENMALLEIEDDGVGFNVGAVDAFYDKRDSLGLVNMRERAELVNGTLRIHSVEGKGTTVQVFIPLTDQAVERLRSRL